MRICAPLYWVLLMVWFASKSHLTVMVTPCRTRKPEPAALSGLPLLHADARFCVRGLGSVPLATTTRLWFCMGMSLHLMALLLFHHWFLMRMYLLLWLINGAAFI
uniref:Secreted protein n=1 Tax=Opuntia streptacantha TaxID=393608 RepID=A0A7C9CWM8_OPUST